MGLIVFGVLEQDLVHVRAGVLEEFIGAVEDDKRYFTVAQNTELVRLLHQTKLSLSESYL